MKNAILLAKWLAVAAVVGPVCGLAVVLFKALASSSRFELYLTDTGNLFYLLPIGGAGVVALVYVFVPGASGEGMPIYVESVRRGVKMRLRGTAGHFASAAVVLASGGSGGMVGPMARVCSGLGQETGRLFGKLRLDIQGVRRATICGAAAGISGILGAPIAGGLFAVEILCADDISYMDVFPAMLSSMASYLVVSRRAGYEPFLGRLAPYDSISLKYLPAFFIVAAAVTGFSVVFAKFFNFYSKAAERHVSRLYARVLAGAGLLAATAFVFGHVGRASLGAGTHFIRQIVAGGLPEVAGMPQGGIAAGHVAVILILLALAKMLSTTFTIGSGLSVGLTYPSILIGAALGSAGSHVASAYGASGTGTHYAFVACGVSAMLSGVMNIPLTAAVLAGEMFGLEYSFAAIIGSVTAFALAKSVTIYTYGTVGGERRQ